MLTFAIGIGSALTAPAWSAIVPELVPREDLVQAIALNGIGYNLTRAVGPALAGFLILLGGSSLAFSLYAVSILAVIGALLTWRRDSRRFTGLPREHLVSAMRAGMRFVRNTPAIRDADGAHHRLFDPGLRALGAAAAVGARAPASRRRACTA